MRRPLTACLMATACLGSACLGAGCAAAPPMAAHDRLPADRALGAQELNRAVAADEELDRVLAGVERCPRACELADRVCTLSRSVCTILARHPDDGELTRMCTDATQRCDRARVRSREACACAP
ncbi:hypothetical protein BAC2_02692 [uncultured bacterium]|nr:hypothetical protein BAC2_02692 [uncultured bacterium]